MDIMEHHRATMRRQVMKQHKRHHIWDIIDADGRQFNCTFLKWYGYNSIQWNPPIAHESSYNAVLIRRTIARIDTYGAYNTMDTTAATHGISYTWFPLTCIFTNPKCDRPKTCNCRTTLIHTIYEDATACRYDEWAQKGGRTKPRMQRLMTCSRAMWDFLMGLPK